LPEGRIEEGKKRRREVVDKRKKIRENMWEMGRKC
jgi:hypothetical protein